MNEVMTQRDDFISRNIKPNVKDIQKFLLYFAEILQIGVEKNLITLDDQINIASRISSAIDRMIIYDEEDDFADTSTLISNCFYVLTLYLSTMNNWDIWCELMKIRTVDDASTLLTESRFWLKSELKKLESSVYQIKTNTDTLKMYKGVYAYITSMIRSLQFYESAYSGLDLKNEHGITFFFTEYSFIHENDFDNKDYFECFKLLIEYFEIETSILVKVNAKEVFEKKKDESDKFFFNQAHEIEKLDTEMADKKIIAREKFIKDLETTDDENALRRQYEKELKSIDKTWEKQFKKLSAIQDNENANAMFLLGDTFTLYDFIKEFHIFAKCDIYPKNIQERATVFDKLDFKESVQIFIDSFKTTLSSAEINYLKTYITG